MGHGGGPTSLEWRLEVVPNREHNGAAEDRPAVRRRRITRVAFGDAVRIVQIVRMHLEEEAALRVDQQAEVDFLVTRQHDRVGVVAEAFAHKRHGAVKRRVEAAAFIGV